jgi:threonine aldolase
LAAGAEEIAGVEILHPVEANSVFLKIPPALDQHLQEKGWKYYHFIGGGARFMCSWQTTTQDVEALLKDMSA